MNASRQSSSDWTCERYNVEGTEGFTTGFFIFDSEAIELRLYGCWTGGTGIDGRGGGASGEGGERK